MRDLGSTYLALALLLGVSAALMERHLVFTALAAQLVVSVPHLDFHVTHTAGLSTGEAITQNTSLVLLVLVPITLLIVNRAASPNLTPGPASDAPGSRGTPGRNR